MSNIRKTGSNQSVKKNDSLQNNKKTNKDIKNPKTKGSARGSNAERSYSEGMKSTGTSQNKSGRDINSSQWKSS